MCVSVCYILFICIRRVQSKKRTIGAKNAWHAICINFFICLQQKGHKKKKQELAETEMDAARSTHTVLFLCVDNRR